MARWSRTRPRRCACRKPVTLQVQYIPLADVVQDRLIRTETSTYCPFKGEASYYSVTTDAGDIVDDVMWTYENPYPAVAAIAGHVACYPDKAEISIFPG